MEINNQQQNEVNQQTILFGQTISIQSSNIKDVFLFSDGLIKTKVMAWQLNQNTIAAGTNFQACLFEVLPSFVTNRVNTILQITSNPILNLPKKNNEDFLRELQEKLIIEYKQNLENAEKLKGSPVQFGQLIQLLHVQSNKFLCCKYQEAETEKDNFRLELDCFPSENSCFYLKPYYKHAKNENNTIKNNENFIIVMKNMYLGKIPTLGISVHPIESKINTLSHRQILIENKKIHKKSLTQRKRITQLDLREDTIIELPNQPFCKTKEKLEEKNVQIHSNYLQEKQKSSANMHGLNEQQFYTSDKENNEIHTQYKTNKYEANVHLEKQNEWSFQIFKNWDCNDNYIYYGDVFWLNQLELNSLFVTSKGVDNTLIISFKVQKQQITGSSNGMWVFENQEFKFGGPIFFNQNLRIRHFSLGLYLTLLMYEGGLQQLILSEKAEDNNLFQLLPMAQSDQNLEVNKNSFFVLKSAKYMEDCFINFDCDRVASLMEEGIFVNLSNIPRELDIIRVIKCSKTEIWEVNFLTSCFPIIRKTIKRIKNLIETYQTLGIDNAQEQLDYLKENKCIDNMTQCVELIIKFIQNIQMPTKIDLNAFHQVNRARQNIFRESFILDVFILLAQLLMTREEIDFSENQLQMNEDLMPSPKKSRQSSIHTPGKEIQIELKSENSNSEKKSRMSFKEAVKLARNNISVINQMKKFVQESKSKFKKEWLIYQKKKLYLLGQLYNSIQLICKDNVSNSVSVYRCMHQFIYQYLHIKESSECIVSIISQNEEIVSNLSDKIKVGIKRGKEVNQKKDQSLRDKMMFIKSMSTQSQSTKSYEDKIIMYLVGLLKQKYEEKIKPIQNFFLKICKYQERGISANQEILYHFMKEFKQFENALFVNCKVEDSVLYFDQKNSNEYQSIYDIQEEDRKLREEHQKLDKIDKHEHVYFLDYINGQLELYSDLCLSRNYLWKNYLNKKFTMEFLFSAIFDQDLNKSIRSSLAKLTISMFIDYEPFQQNHLPKLCRVFHTILDDRPKINIEMNLYQKLLDNSLIMLNQEIKRFYKQKIPMEAQLQEEKENLYKQLQYIDIDDKQDSNIFNDSLILDLINIIQMMLKFNIIAYLQSKDYLYKIAPVVIQLVEFNHKNEDIAINLNKQRKERITAYKQSVQKNLLLKGLTSVMTSVQEGVKKVSKKFIQTAENLIGKNQRTNKLEEEIEDIQKDVLIQNPIMAGLMSLNQIILGKLGQMEKSESENCIQLKKSLCEILNFMNSKREDQLIQNTLFWFREFFNEKVKNNDLTDEKLHELYIDQFQKFMPAIMYSGIYSLDHEKKEKKQNLFTIFLKIMKKFEKLVQNQVEFHNYLSHPILDLDLILTEDPNVKCHLPILPSIVLSFITAENLIIQTELISLLRLCFSQRENLIQNLSQMEIIFDKRQEKVYYKLKNCIELTKNLGEQSELWIKDLLNNTISAEYEKIIEILEFVKDFLKEGQIFARQRIFYQLQGHHSIITLLKDSQNQLNKIFQNEERIFSQKTRNAAKNLLCDLYKVLTSFCENNFQNKCALNQNMSLFLDEIRNDFNQMDLISTIHKNNRLLLTSVQKQFIKQIYDCIVKFGRQKRFLKLLTTLMQMNGTGMLENQDIIISEVIPTNFMRHTEQNLEKQEQILFGSFNCLKEGKIDFEFDLQQQSASDHDQPAQYLSQLLEMFKLSIQGQESYKLNSFKLKQIFPLSNLLGMLLMTDLFSDFNSKNQGNQTKAMLLVNLKGNVVKFMNQLYLNSYILYSDNLLKYQGEFMKLFTKESMRISSNLISTEYLELYKEYLYEGLLETIRLYAKKIFNFQSDELKQREDYECIVDFVRSIKLSSILNSFSTSDELQKISIILEWLESQNTDILNQQILTSRVRQKEQQNNDHLRSASLLMVSNDENVPLVDHEQKSPNDIEEQTKLQDTFQNFLNFIQENPEIQKLKQQEIQKLCHSIIRSEEFLSQGLQRKKSQFTIGMKPLISKFIVYIQEVIGDPLNKSNILFVLNVLQNLIQCFPNKEEAQNTLNQLDCTRMILQVLSEYDISPFDDEVYSSLLSLLIKLLEGGNKKVQKQIYNFFITIKQTENIFIKFYRSIQQNIQDQQRTKEINELNIGEELVQQILRLLQLFCEGHYLDMQNYMTLQFNCRNNYNMILSIVELINIYQQNISANNFEQYSQALETLIEFLQGPCHNNQNIIIDSQYLDIANQLFHSSAKKLNQMQNIIEKWQMSRLKFKCILLIMAMLEMNYSDNFVIKKILRLLPIEIVKSSIIEVFKKFKKYYGQEFISSQLDTHSIEVNDENKKQCEAIIECGFYLYFLLQGYIELDEKDVDQEFATQIKKIKEKNKGGSSIDSLKNSSLGQLATFVYSLVSGILLLINSIRERIQSEVKKQLKLEENQEDIDKKQEMKEIKKQQIFEEAITFFQQNSVSTEVLVKSKLFRLRFIKMPYCRFLNKEMKNEFNDDVNRDSSSTKVTYLMEKSILFIQQMKLDEQLSIFFSQNKFIALFANYINLWKDICFILTIWINFIIITSFRDLEPPNLRSFSAGYSRMNMPTFFNGVMTTSHTLYMFFVCGLLMIICSTFVVVFFLLKKTPIYFKEVWEKSQDILEQDNGFLINTLIYLFVIGQCILRTLMNIDVIFYLAYGVFAFIATYSNPLFFSFHLTELIIRYPTMINIIRSFWQPKTAILLTFVLIFMTNYFFTIISYITLSEFYGSSDSSVSTTCDTLLFCIFVTFDQAFKNNGGVGGWMDGNYPNQVFKDGQYQNYKAGRFFFDNFYNILILIIFMQIFSGIIIDTFGALRDLQQLKDKDKDEICFICGYNREQFDRRSEIGFNQHIKQEHYMWSYLFLIAYIKDRPSTELNGVEEDIYKKIKQLNYQWMPVSKALAFQNVTVEGNADDIKKIQKIQTHCSSTRTKAQELMKII